ncbi:MAG TPA: TlpA disulfide reductase family protein [Bryobacteraceae bacterium]|nr:TlpA disulfide reductase family protein [Bryobacteraceae bacterium]
MRRIIAILPALALAAGLSAQSRNSATVTAPKVATKAAPKTPELPAMAPRPAGEFVIHMVDGPDKLLSSYRGKLVLMAFMFTTCPHCQHTSQLLSKIQTEYAPKGVQILGVTIDQGAKQGIPGFIKITGADFPVGYSDAPTALKFMHVTPDKDWYVPMIAFIDQKGMVRAQCVSFGEGGAPDEWLEAQDGDPSKGDKGSIRRELDKYLRTGASAGSGRRAAAK